MTDLALVSFETTAAVVAPILVYILILRRFADAVMPYRLEMAAVGERILATKPSAVRRAQTQFYLDNAFSGWVAPFAAICLPFVSIWVAGSAVYRLLILKGRRPVLDDGQSSRDDQRMAILFTVSVFAANPLFGSLLVLEFLLVGIVLVVISGTDAVMAAIAALIRAETALKSVFSLGRMGAALTG
jgi:hypothetical protein